MTDHADPAPHAPAPVDPRRRFQPRGQGFNATLMLAYERPVEDPSYPEIWCYTDRLSYLPGEAVAIHASATIERFTIQVVRDGAEPRVVGAFEVSAPLTLLGPGFLEDGCDWPAVHRWRIPSGLASGFYLLLARGVAADGTVREQEHGFFVRAARPGESARILLVAATCTWTAYNDWGGGNHYLSDLVEGLPFAPRLTTHRPFARGLLWLPPDAPRRTHAHAVPPGAALRHPCFEFAYARGYSKFYASAGWATYEHPFAAWAERNGFALDYATQHDLHADPGLLDGYACAAFVGHDEYWTWEMRDAVDRFVERGGNVARFAGNFYWQARLEQGGTRQVCYKWAAHQRDPVMGTDAQRRLTSTWEDGLVARPGAETFGLNGAWGTYAGVGGMAPRGPNGFTVYRPEHWCLAGSDLYYGDVLGSEARIFGYEVDGLDYVVRDGLPYPVPHPGVPDGVEIIAMGLACNTEAMRGGRGEVGYFASYGDPAAELASFRYGGDTPDNRAKASRGSGMVVTFRRGAGTVFHAGTCDWVAGLKARDHGVEAVTRNVLSRLSSRGV